MLVNMKSTWLLRRSINKSIKVLEHTNMQTFSQNRLCHIFAVLDTSIYNTQVIKKNHFQ